MRILEIDTFGRGGLTHYAYNLSGALGRRGHDVTFVTAATYELEGHDDVPEGVRVEQLFMRFTPKAPRWVPGFAMSLARKLEAIHDGFALYRAARRLRPDVIHLHCTNPVALLYLALLKCVGCAVVYTAHDVTPHERIPFQDAIYGRLYGYADLVVAHSEVDRRRLRDEFDLGDDRVVVIPHGEYGFFESGGAPLEPGPARTSLGLEEGDEVALFFGYIREYKGLDLLLEAWPAVTAARPRARLVIAGDPVQLGGARRGELEAWAERVGAVHRFEYVPFSDVTRYFGAADLLVLPYRHISQSGVLFLALSVGVPVLATTVGALPEILTDGESGLLVPPGDTGALAEALVRALGDPALRTRLADGGRAVAASHSWDSIAERTENEFAQRIRGQRV